MKSLLGVLLAVLIAACSGCSAGLDPDQARTCRIILPVLHRDGAVLRVLRQAPIGGRPGVAIDYLAQERGEERRLHVAVCAFADRKQTSDPLDLVGLTADERPFTAVELLMLKRFWLATSEAAVSDPSPVPGAEAVAEAPHAVVYAVQQAANALPLAAIYGLLAASYSLVYGLLGRVNLAFGEFAAIGGYAAFLGISLVAGHAMPLALGVALLLAGSAGAFHGLAAARLVFAPLRRATGQQVLVATVGLALFLQEYLRLTQGSTLIWLGPMLATPLALVRSGDFVATVTPIALLVTAGSGLVALALLATMKRSRFGRAWRATADDPVAAALFGVDPRRMLAQTLTLASMLAGLSGFVMTVFYGSVGYGASTALGLKALIAAILGGIGSIPGAFLGGIAIGALEAVWSALFPIVYRDLATYVLLVALLVWRPGGFLGFGDLSPRRV